MDFRGFLDELRGSGVYGEQMVYVREVSAKEGRYGELREPLDGVVAGMLARRGIERLYVHQAAAVEAVREGRDVVVATGTASGKSLCYMLPLLEMLARDEGARALLVFPTKALCQDQCLRFCESLREVGRDDVLAGVYDGDTPGTMRRKLRDHGRVIFTNPDMLHAGMMPQQCAVGGIFGGVAADGVG